MPVSLQDIGHGNHFASQVLICSETTPMYTEYVDWNGKEIRISDIGVSIDIPQYAVPYGLLVKISVCALMNIPFILPAGLELVSPIYFVTTTPDTVFKKKVMLSLDHWAKLDTDTTLVFVFAPYDPQNPQISLQFEAQEGGMFSQHFGTIFTRHFCRGAIARFLRNILRIPLPVMEPSESSESDGNSIYLLYHCNIII